MFHSRLILFSVFVGHEFTNWMFSAVHNNSSFYLIKYCIYYLKINSWVLLNKILFSLVTPSIPLDCFQFQSSPITLYFWYPTNYCSLTWNAPVCRLTLNIVFPAFSCIKILLQIALHYNFAKLLIPLNSLNLLNWIHPADQKDKSPVVVFLNYETFYLKINVGGFSRSEIIIPVIIGTLWCRTKNIRGKSCRYRIGV